MYFVKPGYENAVVYGRKRIVLASATQDELKQLFLSGHKLISETTKKKHDEVNSEKPKHIRKKQE